MCHLLPSPIGPDLIPRAAEVHDPDPGSGWQAPGRTGRAERVLDGAQVRDDENLEGIVGDRPAICPRGGGLIDHRDLAAVTRREGGGHTIVQADQAVR